MAGLTYAQFHAVFVLPVLFVLVAAAGLRRSGEHDVRPVAVVAVVAAALAYTVPWDNYLVRRGVWSYGADRVVAVLWHAPVEEYLFILLQPLVVTAWLYHVSDGDQVGTVVTRRERLVGAGAGLGIGAIGLALLPMAPTHYLGAILAWAGPVLALQWAVGWPHLVDRWRTLVVGVVPPALYLSMADLVAIRAGVWTLSRTYTTGLTLGGLPVEEAVFFLLTTVFVVQGLLLYPWVVRRWRAA